MPGAAGVKPLPDEQAHLYPVENPMPLAGLRRNRKALMCSQKLLSDRTGDSEFGIPFQCANDGAHSRARDRRTDSSGHTKNLTATINN